MIPLRPFLIVQEHRNLPYPEGTACAEVLKASQMGGARARNVFLGLGLGALFKGVTGWMRAVPDELQISIPFLRKGQLGTAVSAALFGVGYILGPRIATIMVGGGLLSWLVIIPAMAWWGEGRMVPLYPETTLVIDEMTPGLLWTRYVRYIGAGAVATGGLITLIRSVPTMVASFRIGARQIRERLTAGAGTALLRTERDLSLGVVGVGALAIFAILAVVPMAFSSIEVAAGRALAALLVVVFAFFFVTVSSRIVGLVGVTSNPTSGMTIATLLGTSSLFLLLGWTDDAGKVAALTVGAVVAIAASDRGRHVAGSEDRLPARGDAAASADWRTSGGDDLRGVRGVDAAAPGPGVWFRRRRAPRPPGDADAARHRRGAQPIAPLDPRRRRRWNRHRRRAAADPIAAVRGRRLSPGFDDDSGLPRRVASDDPRARCRDERGAGRPARPGDPLWVRFGGWGRIDRGGDRRCGRLCGLSRADALEPGRRLGRRGGGVARAPAARRAHRRFLAPRGASGRPTTREGLVGYP